jgi:hypothetical protein
MTPDHFNAPTGLAALVGWRWALGIVLAVFAGVVVLARWATLRCGDDRPSGRTARCLARSRATSTRRNQDRWRAEAAAMLRKQGRLRRSSARDWALTLHDRFGERWSGREAAEWQLDQWQRWGG